MSRKPPDPSIIGGKALDAVEDNIDLRPADPVAFEIVQELLRIVSALAVPQLLEVAKSVSTLGGLAWQRRKAERAKDLVLGLYELLQRTRFEYVKRVEFEDLLEEVLRRVSQQPDDGRRETMRNIFLKIIEAPREHVENRLLLRLADELPAAALKALAVLDLPLATGERDLQMARNVLAGRLGIPSDEVFGLLTYMVNENLFDDQYSDVLVGIGPTAGNISILLTPLGRTFVEYARGSSGSYGTY